MKRYIESAFRVKWRLIIAAILVTGVASGALYLSKQGIYTSSAGVWVDRPIYAPLDPGTNTYITPATVQAGIFDQLLRTHQFTLQIAKNAHVPMPNSILEEAAVTDLQKNLLVDAIGPNLIKVTYTANKSTYVKPIMDAAISLFKDASTSDQLAQAQQTLKLYQQQIDSATKDMNASKDAVSAYIQSHPDAGKSSSNDPTYTALSQQAGNDRQRVDDIQAKIDDLNLRINTKTQLSDIIFRIVDEPADAQPYRFGLKDLLRNEGIAFALGLLAIIALTLVATWTDRSVYTLNDISSLALNDQPASSTDLLVGVVPYVKSLGARRQEIVKHQGAKSGRRGRKGNPRVSVVDDNAQPRPPHSEGVSRPIEALPDGGAVAGRTRS